MSPLLRWFRRSFVEPATPTVGVELRATSVGVVRTSLQAGRPTFVAASALDLEPGVLKLSMTEPNVIDKGALVRTLRAALERAGVLSGGPVVLVLPDPVARVTLLDAPEIRGKSNPAALELLRFKLQKSVPFEIRQAHVRWSPAGDPGSANVVVTAMLPAVIGGYEEVCREAGLVPGQVELCGLALLRAGLPVLRQADRLLVNWDDSYVTLVLTRGAWPLFVRTLGAEVAGDSESVVREVRNTVLYYRDHLGGTELAGTAIRAAHIGFAEASTVLQPVLGGVPDPLDPSPRLPGVPAAGLDANLTGCVAALLGEPS